MKKTLNFCLSELIFFLVATRKFCKESGGNGQSKRGKVDGPESERPLGVDGSKESARPLAA